jgi:hypothetical protein
MSLHVAMRPVPRRARHTPSKRGKSLCAHAAEVADAQHIRCRLHVHSTSSFCLHRLHHTLACISASFAESLSKRLTPRA